MAQFDRQIATAKRLIKKNGQPIIWQSIAVATPDDATEPWNGGTATPIEYPNIPVCFVPVRDIQTRKFLKHLTGTEVPIGSLAGLMGNVNFEPKIKDIVIRDGQELRISTIDLLSPNGQKILYTLEFEQ